jgi:hypothetical protein
MARKNIWEQIWESTEGPTVTVTIPRDHAESLLQVLAASLEQDVGGDDMDGDGDMDLDSMHDLDFGGDDDMAADDGMGMDDMDMPAGDDDDDMGPDFGVGDEPAPKKGPGRPPGSKNKKKSDDGEKKKDKPKKDDGGDEKEKDDEDTKEEGAGEYRPQTALGESAFARAARALARPRRKR